jgi:hypothetical protein
MEYTTSTTNITKFQSRGIAYVVFISQLLTSCGGTARELQADPTALLNAPFDAGSTSLPKPALPAESATSVEKNTVEVTYLNLASEAHTIPVDLAHTSVAAFLERIKQQERLVDAGCRFVVREEAYNEADTRPLSDILDAATMHEEPLTIIKISNAALAQELLGNNYLGAEAWRQLGIELEINLPIVSDKLLAKVRRLHAQGDEPILVLDLGKSIEEIERLCQAKSIIVLSTEDEGDKSLRAEAFYQAVGTGCFPRWLLLPSSDHGVLPGTRKKDYDTQVKHMQTNYPGYEVGGVRELVTLSMLKYAQDSTVLFPEEPWTYGRCKEEYQTGDWKGWRVVLGKRFSSASGGLVVDDVVGSAYDSYGLFCLLVGF